MSSTTGLGTRPGGQCPLPRPRWSSPRIHEMSASGQPPRRARLCIGSYAHPVAALHLARAITGAQRRRPRPPACIANLCPSVMAAAGPAAGARPPDKGLPTPTERPVADVRQEHQGIPDRHLRREVSHAGHRHRREGPHLPHHAAPVAGLCLTNAALFQDIPSGRSGCRGTA